MVSIRQELRGNSTRLCQSNHVCFGPRLHDTKSQRFNQTGVPHLWNLSAAPNTIGSKRTHPSTLQKLVTYYSPSGEIRALVVALIREISPCRLAEILRQVEVADSKIIERQPFPCGGGRNKLFPLRTTFRGGVSDIENSSAWTFRVDSARRNGVTAPVALLGIPRHKRQEHRKFPRWHQ